MISLGFLENSDAPSALYNTLLSIAISTGLSFSRSTYDTASSRATLNYNIITYCH